MTVLALSRKIIFRKILSPEWKFFSFVFPCFMPKETYFLKKKIFIRGFRPFPAFPAPETVSTVFYGRFTARLVRNRFPAAGNPTLPQTLIYSFQGNINDTRCDIMIKRCCGATSRGLRRPPPVALGSCRPLESSNECQNKFSHAPKPLYTHFKAI